MDQILALTKFLASFFKREWLLADYPVRLLERKSAPLGRLKPLTWTALIINWSQMRGAGFSREEALDELNRHFQAFSKTNNLPRPGTSGPKLELTFAPCDQISRYEEIAYDVVDKLFGLQRSDCLLTDESTLWDFHTEESNDRFIAAIIEIYGVDARTLAKPRIADIAKLVYQCGRHA